MHLSQLASASIATIFFTLTAYYLPRVIFVYRRIDRYFYYSITTLCGGLFSLFGLVLSAPLPDDAVLLFHRLRMVALLLTIVFWMFCTYAIFFKEKSWIPRGALAVSVFIICTIPSDLYVSLPVRHVHVEWLGIPFDYRFGQTNVFYSVYAVCLLACFSVSLIKVLASRITLRMKLLGVLAFLPGVLGAVHDFPIAHGYKSGVMINEYIAFLFLLATSTVFLTEDEQNHRTLQNMAVELERKVRERTEQLERLNRELAGMNEDLRQANELKSELLGIAAHDLKNPLQSVMGYGELISNASNVNEKIFRYANLIHQSSQRMLALVNELLDATAIESGKLELQRQPLSLARLAEAAVTAYQDAAARKSQTLRLDVADAGAVSADASRLRQVLDNLLSNAVKYTPPGKTITVWIGADGGRVRCEVRDEGPGLSEADRAQVFGKFHRLSAKPTGGEPSVGLGLFIVKQLVDAHGGRVGVDSPPGGGAAFWFELPAAGA